MYGTVYGLSTAVVHVAHPLPAGTILSATTCSSSGARRRSSVASVGATKAPAYNHFKDFCGEGVFTADGDDWKEKRAIVMHSLLRTNDTSFEGKVEREAHTAGQRLVADLEALMEKDERRDDDGCLRINVVPFLQRATIGLIYRYITHCEIDTSVTKLGAKKEDYLVDPVVDHSDSASLLPSYLNSITRIRMIILAQSRSIWFLLPRWVYRAFSSLYKEEQETMVPIREFAVQACRNAAPGSPLAVMQSKPIYASLSSNDFSKNLLDEAITLLFAGQDTSAATLSWTLHLLSLYPKVQDKLAEEVMGVMDELEDHFISKKIFSKLPYLDAVIKESMRLYPVAPFVVRRLPFPLPIKTESSSEPLVLPADSVACVWIYGLHRNPAFWNRPDDFLPERWLVEDPTIRDQGITNGAYMPFAVGPRNCVGQPLAHVILRSLLTRLVSKFEFRDERVVDPDVDGIKLRKDMQAGFTVLPEGGVEVTLQRRRCKVN